ncbi:MAG TPA: M15 family metallopeptidase, partial [Polyangiaceae bacterium]|nr:M15 family metallopeptidase [Polyangiaceae bacterium]
MWRVGTGILLSLSVTACSAAEPLADNAEHCEEPAGTVAEALSSIDCKESKDTGYTSGKPFSITVVTVDGKKVERDTANAYYVMAKAADKAGVTLKVVSGFRTQAEQQYLYNCYVNCNCNNCNLAAKPGYSNHQSGHALDLNTSSAGVLTWLNSNGATYGFKRTVPSEAWHWEWWSGGPGGGPCAVEYAGKSLGLSGQSYPITSQGAVTVEVGQTVTGWVKLENIGSATWKPGSVWLAPIPRDKPNALSSPSWQSTTRISTVKANVPPGSVGTFDLDLTGKTLGETTLELGWVAEGVTWFADGPKGGGPADGYFAVKVQVVASTGSDSAGDGPGAAGAGGDAG